MLIFRDDFAHSKTTHFVWAAGPSLSQSLSTHVEDFKEILTETKDNLSKLNNEVIKDGEVLNGVFTDIQTTIYEAAKNTETPEQETVVLDWIRAQMTAVGVDSSNTNVIKILGLFGLQDSRFLGVADPELTLDVEDFDKKALATQQAAEIEANPDSQSTATDAVAPNAESLKNLGVIHKNAVSTMTRLSDQGVLSAVLPDANGNLGEYSMTSAFWDWLKIISKTPVTDPVQQSAYGTNTSAFLEVFGGGVPAVIDPTNPPGMPKTLQPELMEFNNFIFHKADWEEKNKADLVGAMQRIKTKLDFLGNFFAKSPDDLLVMPKKLVTNYSKPDNSRDIAVESLGKVEKAKQAKFKELIKKVPNIKAKLKDVQGDGAKTDILEIETIKLLALESDTWIKNQTELRKNIADSPGFPPALAFFIDNFEPELENILLNVVSMKHDPKINSTERFSLLADKKNKIEEIFRTKLKFGTLAGVDFESAFRLVSNKDMETQFSQLQNLTIKSPEHDKLLAEFKENKNAVMWIYDIAYKKGVTGLEARNFVDSVLSSGLTFDEIKNGSDNPEINELIDQKLESFVALKYTGMAKFGLYLNHVKRVFGGFLDMIGFGGGKMGNDRQNFDGEIGGFMAHEAENSAGKQPVGSDAGDRIKEDEPGATELSSETKVALDTFLGTNPTDPVQLKALVDKYKTLESLDVLKKLWNPTKPTNPPELADSVFTKNLSDLRKSIMTAVAGKEGLTDKWNSFGTANLLQYFDLDYAAPTIDKLPKDILTMFVGSTSTPPSIDLLSGEAGSRGEILKTFIDGKPEKASLENWKLLGDSIYTIAATYSDLKFVVNDTKLDLQGKTGVGDKARELKGLTLETWDNASIEALLEEMKKQKLLVKAADFVDTEEGADAENEEGADAGVADFDKSNPIDPDEMVNHSIEQLEARKDEILSQKKAAGDDFDDALQKELEAIEPVLVDKKAAKKGTDDPDQLNADIAKLGKETGAMNPVPPSWHDTIRELVGKSMSLEDMRPVLKEGTKTDEIYNRLNYVTAKHDADEELTPKEQQDYDLLSGKPVDDKSGEGNTESPSEMAIAAGKIMSDISAAPISATTGATVATVVGGVITAKAILSVAGVVATVPGGQLFGGALALGVGGYYLAKKYNLFGLGETAEAETNDQSQGQVQDT
jgi:hypothetical protein